MSKLMSNDLVKNHYTWAGRCENKKSFSDLSLKRLVIGTHVLTAINILITVVIVVHIMGCI